MVKVREYLWGNKNECIIRMLELVGTCETANENNVPYL